MRDAVRTNKSRSKGVQVKYPPFTDLSRGRTNEGVRGIQPKSQGFLLERIKERMRQMIQASAKTDELEGEKYPGDDSEVPEELKEWLKCWDHQWSVISFRRKRFSDGFT